MERLTYQGSVSALLKSDRRTGEYSGVCLGCRKIAQCTKQQKYCNLFYAIKKLAAYEDTGLTPQEIMDGNMLTGWIPVEERLPETEDGYVHVMVSMDDGFVCTTDYTDNDGFELWADSGEVMAWMPLPEPYRAETKQAEKEEGSDEN